MVIRMFAVLDSKSDGFMTPWFEKTTASGERLFSRLVNDPQSMIYQYPSDFHLFELGDFDQEKGVFTALEKPRNLGPATQYMNLDPTRSIPEE